MSGIEPPTSGTTIRRSNQLSYTHQGSPTEYFSSTPGGTWAQSFLNPSWKNYSIE